MKGRKRKRSKLHKNEEYKSTDPEVLNVKDDDMMMFFFLFSDPRQYNSQVGPGAE